VQTSFIGFRMAALFTGSAASTYVANNLLQSLVLGFQASNFGFAMINAIEFSRIAGAIRHLAKPYKAIMYGNVAHHCLRHCRWLPLGGPRIGRLS
jgi:hypothetical protein